METQNQIPNKIKKTLRSIALALGLITRTNNVWCATINNYLFT